MVLDAMPTQWWSCPILTSMCGHFRSIPSRGQQQLVMRQALVTTWLSAWNMKSPWIQLLWLLHDTLHIHCNSSHLPRNTSQVLGTSSLTSTLTLIPIEPIHLSRRQLMVLRKLAQTLCDINCHFNQHISKHFCIKLTCPRIMMTFSSQSSLPAAFTAVTAQVSWPSNRISAFSTGKR